jgi:hypothetical protein
MAPPTVLPDPTETFDRTHEAFGKQLAELMDIEARMALPIYNAHATTPSPAREKRGYYAQMREKLTQLAQVVTDEHTKQGSNVAEADRLEMTAILAGSVASLYGKLGVATSFKDKSGDAMHALEAITDTQRVLGLAAWDDVGKDNYARIDSFLYDLGQVVLVFPGVASPWASSSLDVFVLQTYRRLQQIAKGNRKGVGETHDIRGALATYANDSSYMAVVHQKLAKLDADLKADMQAALVGGPRKFASEKAFQDAMVDVVQGGSKPFQDAVRNHATAVWATAQGGLYVTKAEGAAQQAADQADEASATLANNCVPYTCSENLYCDVHGPEQSAAAQFRAEKTAWDKSNEEIGKNSMLGARVWLRKAKAAHDQADKYLNAYGELKKKGLASGDQAMDLVARARVSLERADEYTAKVTSGPFATDLAPETATLKRTIANLRARAATVETNVGNIRASFTSSSEQAEALAKANREMGGLIDLNWLRATVDERVVRGRKQVADLLGASGVGLSTNAQAYLRDPEHFPKDNVADVREELVEFFKTHPDKLRDVTRAVMGMRSSFEIARAKLIRGFGTDAESAPHLAQALRLLDDLEYQYIQNWIGSDGAFMEAIQEAGKAVGNTDVSNALIPWIRKTNERQSGNALADPTSRNEMSENLHKGMLADDKLRATYEAALKDFKKAEVARVPIILELDKSGRTMSFNVYVFKDGSTYQALNIFDGRRYSGATLDKAVNNLLKDGYLGLGRARYVDSNNAPCVVDTADHPGPSAWDKVAGGAMLVGGVILLLVPEPSVTKAVGAALVVGGGAYFVGKGTLEIVDLAQHGTLGLNWDTGAAVLDIASGIMAMVDGGVNLSAALPATVRTASPLITTLAGLKNAKPFVLGLNGAGLALLGVNLTSMVVSAVRLSGDASLSHSQRRWAIVENVALTLGPLMVSVGAARLKPGTPITSVHEEMMARFKAIERLWITNNESGNALGAFQANVKLFLIEAARKYDSPEMRARADLRTAGIREIAKLQTILRGLPRTSTLSAIEADLLTSRGIQDDVTGMPWQVKQFGDKVVVNSVLNLPPGSAEGAVAPYADAVADTVRYRFAALAQEKGLEVRGAGTGEVTIVEPKTGAVMIRIRRIASGFGRIEIENSLRGYTEIVELKPLPSEPTAGRPTPPRPGAPPLLRATILDVLRQRGASVTPELLLTLGKAGVPLEGDALEGLVRIMQSKPVAGATLEALLSSVPGDRLGELLLWAKTATTEQLAVLTSLAAEPTAGAKILALVGKDGTTLDMIAALVAKTSVKDVAELAKWQRGPAVAAELDKLAKIDRTLAEAAHDAERASPEALRSLQEIAAKDLAATRKMVAAHGVGKVLEYLHYNPVSDIGALAKVLDALQKRITTPVKGLFAAIDATKPPTGWTFRGRPKPGKNGFIEIDTDVTDAAGNGGTFERWYNPTTNTLEMHNAFLGKISSPLSSWVDASVPMIPGKGVPTVTYMSIVQMKQLGAAFGSLKIVRMCTIQNLRAIAHLQWLRTRFPNAELSELVAQTHSVEYGETAIIQSGHRIKSVKFVPAGVWEDTIGSLMDHFERNGLASAADNDAILARYGIDRSTKTLQNYDIEIEVEPQ